MRKPSLDTWVCFCKQGQTDDDCVTSSERIKDLGSSSARFQMKYQFRWWTSFSWKRRKVSFGIRGRCLANLLESAWLMCGMRTPIVVVRVNPVTIGWQTAINGLWRNLILHLYTVDLFLEPKTCEHPLCWRILKKDIASLVFADCVKIWVDATLMRLK